MRWKMKKRMKWSWFKVPVKVKQINEYLFSDTVQSKKQKSAVNDVRMNDSEKWLWDEITSQGQYRGYPSKSSLGQVQTKVEKKNGRDEFLVFYERE
jgi:hypothetical protein